MKTEFVSDNERLGFEAYRGYYGDGPDEDVLDGWRNLDLDMRNWWISSGHAVKRFLEKEAHPLFHGTHGT